MEVDIATLVLLKKDKHQNWQNCKKSNWKFLFILCLSWKNTAMQTYQCRQNLQEILSASYFSSTSNLIKSQDYISRSIYSYARCWYQGLDSGSHTKHKGKQCHLYIIHILPTVKFKQFENFSITLYLYLSGLLFDLILDKLYLLFSTSGFSLLFFMRIFLLRSLGEGKALPGSSCKII